MRLDVKSNWNVAFTLTELLVIIFVLALLTAMIIPADQNGKAKAQRINCINNLKEVYLGVKVWEGNHNNQYPWAVSSNYGGALEYAENDELFRVFRIASNELATTRILICTADVRNYATNWVSLQNSNISYFLCLDATESYPGMIISGDRNLIGGTRLPNGLTVFNPTNSIHWGPDVHHGQGNIGLTDGSCAQVTSHGLSEAFADGTNGGLSTIRYAFP